MQPVIESAEHAHQRSRLFRAQLQMLGGIENECRVEDSKPEGRKNLNEKQHGRPFRSRGEPALEKFHPPLISLPDPNKVKPLSESRLLIRVPSSSVKDL